MRKLTIRLGAISLLAWSTLLGGASVRASGSYLCAETYPYTWADTNFVDLYACEYDECSWNEINYACTGECWQEFFEQSSYHQWGSCDGNFVEFTICYCEPEY